MSPKKADIQGKYDYFRQVLGMTRILLDQFPDDKMDYRPVPGVRTVAEIAAHMYAFLEEAPRTVLAGEHKKVEEPKLRTKAEVMAYVDGQTLKFFGAFDDRGLWNLGGGVEVSRLRLRRALASSGAVDGVLERVWGGAGDGVRLWAVVSARVGSDKAREAFLRFAVCRFGGLVLDVGPDSY